jgi:hypothetical protein
MQQTQPSAIQDARQPRQTSLQIGIGPAALPVISSRSIIKPAARPRIPVTVVATAAVDITRSSTAFANGIAKTISAILAQTANKAREVVVSVWAVGDEDCGQQPTLLTDRGTVDDANRDIASITFDGGGDPEETHLSSCEHILDATQWSVGRHERDFFIGLFNADTKPSKSGKTASEIGKEFRARGIQVCLVCEPYPQLEEFVSAAGGFLFKISDSPDPAQFQRVSAQVAASIVASITAGATVPMRLGNE